MRAFAIFFLFLTLLHCGSGSGSASGGTVIGSDSPNDQMDEMQLDEATLE